MKGRKHKNAEDFDDISIDAFKTGYFTRKIMEYASMGLRDFPWRKNRNAYRTFIAEFFLQRTKADQVAQIYNEFIDEFPDERALVNADEKSLRKYFQKLGLLKRLDYLIKIIEKIGEITPDKSGSVLESFNEKDLLSLPGVGPYTARAVLCFGKNMRISILDANFIRIFKRFFGIPDRGRLPKSDPFYWRLAGRLLPEENYVEYNYALIDLGSNICLPRKPLCSKCPLIDECIYAKGLKNA